MIASLPKQHKKTTIDREIGSTERKDVIFITKILNSYFLLKKIAEAKAKLINSPQQLQMKTPWKKALFLLKTLCLW